MVRNLTNLSRHTYDVLVIGGGIYGACVAWDAALRGLSVALVEKGDFGHATSSNSLRVIHGGLRYLQHGDIRRVRRSIQERAAFMRIAPHLVHPLPILIPTYGHSLRGKEIFSIALLVNEILGFDQNGLLAGQEHLPRGYVVSKQDCLRMVPGVYEKGLTGAVVVYDCQMSSSERLVLSFARSAHQAGAELANYVEATELLIKAGRVTGAQGRDILTGNELAIRAKIVVNASGPWIEHVLSGLQGHNLWQRMSLSKAFNLLINRQLIANYAVGVYSRGGFRDGDAILDKGSRLLFINPWHNRSLIGTAHLPYRGDPDQFQLTEAEIGAFLNEINEAYPRADLKLKDISRVYAGLLPAVENNSGGVQLARQHQIYDHQADGVDGLISVSGVKFTEARYVAERVVDQVFSKLGKKPTNSTTAVTAVYGGCIEQLNDFTIHETEKRPRELSPEAISLLIRHYGSAYSNVLKYLPDEDPINDSAGFIKAEVLYGIREEMAQKLTDIIFRRTTLAIPGNLTEISLKTCLGIMEKELGWNEQRIQRETEELCCAPFTAITRTEEAA